MEIFCVEILYFITKQSLKFLNFFSQILMNAKLELISATQLPIVLIPLVLTRVHAMRVIIVKKEAMQGWEPA